MTDTLVGAPPRPLRLWPGVVLAAAILFFKLLLPMVAPQSTPLGVLGGPVLGLAIGIWWLFFSRAPWVDRAAVLLRPVSRELTILATFLRIVSLTVQTVAVFFLLAAVYPFGPAPYLNAFTAEQQQVLARLAIRAHADGYGVALLVLGFCFLVHGYLIFRSGFLPRILGRLMQLAGLSYLVNSFALVLVPAVVSRLFPLILLPAFVGELSLSLWLLVKGVDVVKWRALAPSPQP